VVPASELVKNTFLALIEQYAIVEKKKTKNKKQLSLGDLGLEAPPQS
jgi:hypothetical protein